MARARIRTRHAPATSPASRVGVRVPGVDQFRERVPRRAGLHLRREGASRDAIDADAARQSRHRAGGASKRRISLRSPPDGRGSGIRGVRRGEARRRDPDARGRRGDKRRRRMRDTRFYIHARNSAAPPRFYLRPRLLRRGASSTSKHPHRPCQKVFFGGGNFTRSALLMMSRTIFLAMTFGRSFQGVAKSSRTRSRPRPRRFDRRCPRTVTRPPRR